MNYKEIGSVILGLFIAYLIRWVIVFYLSATFFYFTPLIEIIIPTSLFFIFRRKIFFSAGILGAVVITIFELMSAYGRYFFSSLF